jgi:Xaa-Pro dipeptidase
MDQVGQKCSEVKQGRFLTSTHADAREFMAANGINGWLTRDYRYTNPIFWQAFGRHISNVTRPVWLLIPANGEAQLLAHDVDTGRFDGTGVNVLAYSNRASMVDGLQRLLTLAGSPSPKLAMEYSEMYQLPRVSRVDAGTIELVRSLGADVVSSGDLIQYATERWTPYQLETHRFAVERLTRIVKEAFTFAGENVRWALTEHDVAEHIRGRFDRLGLEYDDGPVVAFNQHSSDPHYEPLPGSASVIRRNGWLLIDLWGRQKLEPGSHERAISADITWVAKLGSPPDEHQQQVFDAVKNARDTAFELLSNEKSAGNTVHGWQLDAAARKVIDDAGFGKYFVHRLGHSLGHEVHSNGVNLDDWETHDTRSLIPGIGVTIEPGIYLPDFGVRLEMDVYMGPGGPEITGERQDEIHRIET